jgi:hypothetical protein
MQRSPMQRSAFHRFTNAALVVFLQQVYLHRSHGKRDPASWLCHGCVMVDLGWILGGSRVDLAQLFLQLANLLVPAMPNGNRDPFRISNGEPPSPLHTSDSETTYEEKMRYEILMRWVAVRWKELVKRRRAKKCLYALAAWKLLPQLLPVGIAWEVALFLAGWTWRSSR